MPNKSASPAQISDEQAVKQKYPDADSKLRYVNGLGASTDEDCKILAVCIGSGAGPEAAWADARSRLEPVEAPKLNISADMVRRGYEGEPVEAVSTTPSDYDCSDFCGAMCTHKLRDQAELSKCFKMSTPLPQQEGYEKCTRCRHENNLHNGGISNYCLINGCNCQQFCARGPAALPQQEEPARKETHRCPDCTIECSCTLDENHCWHECAACDCGHELENHEDYTDPIGRRECSKCSCSKYVTSELCGAWMRNSVLHCDRKKGHAGPHRDEDQEIEWSKPIAPLLGQDEPALPSLPKKVRGEDWAKYWGRAFDERTKQLTQALTSLAAAEHDANLWKELHGAVNASLVAQTERIETLSEELYESRMDLFEDRNLVTAQNFAEMQQRAELAEAYLSEAQKEIQELKSTIAATYKDGYAAGKGDGR